MRVFDWPFNMRVFNALDPIGERVFEVTDPLVSAYLMWLLVV